MKVLSIIAVCSILFVASVDADDTETTVERSEIPEAVLKAFELAYPEAIVSAYCVVLVEEKKIYQVETKREDLEVDFFYLADGTLYQIEEDIPLNSLPELVAESVKKAFSITKIDEASKVTRGETILFVIDVEVGETEYELVISPTGKILSSAMKNDEADLDGETKNDGPGKEDD